MPWKVVAFAVIATQSIAFAAAAQNRGGPAELPPPGFAGAQYVDSTGCAFVRAGHGGQVTWVRRIGNDRRPLCGLQPTAVGMERARARLAAEAAAPAAVPAAPPAPAAAAPRRASAPPQVAAAPRSAPQPAPAAPSGVQCPPQAPVAQRFELVGGGAVVLCLEAGVTISGARPGEPARPPAAVAPGRGAMVVDPRVPTPAVPRGYRLAWDDGRLNPHRGPRTAAGDAQMHTIWTADVPQHLHVEPPTRPWWARRAEPAPQVTVSTRGAAAPRAAAAQGAYVQVGSFAVAANARSAEARLAALGLPVRTVRGAAGGKPVAVVRAGPFTSEGEGQAALAAARAAGFGDAVLRR